MVDLRSIIASSPDCLTSRAKFKTTLLDKYPRERRIINVLTSLFEMGLVTALKQYTAIDKSEMLSFVSLVKQDYAYETQYIQEGIEIWAKALGVIVRGSAVLPKLPRRDLDILYLVDTSQNTRGDIIGALNSTFEESLVSDLAQLEENCLRCQINLRILQINSSPRWTTVAPVSLSDFIWNDLQASGQCDINKAFELLNDHLDTFYDQRCYPPIIIFFLANTPKEDYTQALTSLKQNHWYKKAIKVGVEICEHSPKSLLVNFCDSNELILNIHQKESLLRIVSQSIYDDGIWCEDEELD